MGQLQECGALIMGLSEDKRERLWNGRSIWNGNDYRYPQINVRYENTDPEHRVDKCQKTTPWSISTEEQKNQSPERK